MVVPMSKWSIAIAGCLAIMVIGATYRSQAATPQAAPRAVIDKYCVTCHNRKLKTAGLLLDSLDLSRVGDHAEVWEKVARKFRTHEMPPPGLPRPDQATYADVTTQLEAALDAAAAA